MTCSSTEPSECHCSHGRHGCGRPDETGDSDDSVEEDAASPTSKQPRVEEATALAEEVVGEEGEAEQEELVQ